ncbi:MAG: GIY-YIG nuclease family protein [Candidatus Sungbacteria bacterium]|nr:GIY-YIG nuclease family protein [Candidatus Sungbacteria bacterium]
MGIRTFIDNWKKKRAERAIERKRLNDLFEKFLIETRPLTPKASKYPEAALLRHAWKRAAILAYLFKDIPNSEKDYLYKNFAEIAAKKYYRIAPEGAYGKIPLKIARDVASKLLEKEKELLFPQKIVPARSRELACIYLGIDDHGRYYVGQTLDAPEFRWVQHRANNTGPFKKGATYVEWKVLERNVDQSDLNRKESYYIGLYNSVTNGYNDTRGNDLVAYEKGLSENRTKATKM